MQQQTRRLWREECSYICFIACGLQREGRFSVSVFSRCGLACVCWSGSESQWRKKASKRECVLSRSLPVGEVQKNEPSQVFSTTISEQQKCSVTDSSFISLSDRQSVCEAVKHTQEESEDGASITQHCWRLHWLYPKHYVM